MCTLSTGPGGKRGSRKAGAVRSAGVFSFRHLSRTHLARGAQGGGARVGGCVGACVWDRSDCWYRSVLDAQFVIFGLLLCQCTCVVIPARTHPQLSWMWLAFLEQWKLKRVWRFLRMAVPLCAFCWSQLAV